MLGSAGARLTELADLRGPRSSRTNPDLNRVDSSGLERRCWSVAVKPRGFRALGGESELSQYRPGASSGLVGSTKEVRHL